MLPDGVGVGGGGAGGGANKSIKLLAPCGISGICYLFIIYLLRVFVFVSATVATVNFVVTVLAYLETVAVQLCVYR